MFYLFANQAAGAAEAVEAATTDSSAMPTIDDVNNFSAQNGVAWTLIIIAFGIGCFGVYKLIGWVGANIIKPFTDKGISYLDVTSESSKRTADAVEIQTKINEQTANTMEVIASTQEDIRVNGERARMQAEATRKMLHKAGLAYADYIANDNPTLATKLRDIVSETDVA